MYMYKMTQPVILVIALVLVNSQGKIILRENSLKDAEINVISKNDLEQDLQVRIILPTTTPEDESRNIKPTEEFETDNKIKEISDNNINNSSRNSPVNNDTNSPLILTPFLRKGLFEDARKASRVDPSLFLGVESYSGFLTVNETYNSNLFFWYFPSEMKPVNETPLIIWLQGGPGASSLNGLFDEIGPFMVNSNDSLIRNPYTWLQNHSLLFIDNPVGAGYSFTEHRDGFTKDMATYSNHLFSTVQQFLQVFPELRQAPLFVAGESYAGKYVPALATKLHMYKDSPGQNVNLQGLMIGNGYVDPAMIAQIANIFYYFGLLEKKEIDTLEPLAKAFQRDIANHDSVGAKNKFTSLVSVLLFLSNQKHAYNFLKDDIHLGHFSQFLKRPEIKNAIHVGGINFTFINVTTNIKMAPDFLSSAKPLMEELLEHYRVLAYCGQLDQMLPCVFTSENYRTWQWSGASEFLQATRYPFIFKGSLAGYSKTGGRLTEVIVRGAGHMVPMDVPAPARDLVTRWTRGLPIAARSFLREGPFVDQFVANNSASIYL